MSPLVVLFTLVAAACGSLIPVQPPYHSAVVLDTHGRPLDTAEVINARALHLQAKHLEGSYAPLVHAAPLAVAHAAPLAIAHAAPIGRVAPIVTTYVGGSAVSHQSRVDVQSSPAVVAHSAIASPLLAHSALRLGHGHWLRKRSLGHLAYAAPVVAPAAVSHQSRVDVISSPAVVSHAVAPVVAHAPLVAHVTPAAVSHQSRVDVRSSPAILSQTVVTAPVVAAHSAWATPAVSAHSAWASPALAAHSSWGSPFYGAHGLGHLLKKRSLALAHLLPSAVSHQSHVDVISGHAAPVAIAHSAPIAVAAHVAIAPVSTNYIGGSAVSQQSRVDVTSSPAHITPLAHSAVWTAPISHLSHSPLALASHW